MQRRIYLDHAATTPVDPRVMAAMLPYLTTCWGNPSSVYQEAREARKGLDDARRTVAEVLGARPAEIVFTAGGSEADNLAIRGVLAATRRRGHHVITSAIEHHAVLHTVQALEREGLCRATYLPVDGEGVVDLDALEGAVGDDTVLVSVMLANNEVGSVQPVAEIARIVKRRNPRALVHTDAVQAAGALPLEVDALGVDLLSLAAHKFYGPKGVGVLYVRGRTPLVPQVLGGAQERNRRAGTENVAGAVGLAVALRLATDERAARVAHATRLRDRLLEGVPARVPGVRRTGPPPGPRRIAGNASFCFAGIEAEALLLQLDMSGVAASAGSACTSASLEPSHVLLAMGVPEDLARGSLRLTVGVDNTDADVDYVLEVLPRFVARLRALSTHERAAPAVAGG
jgi:cysteine desulfurase